MGWLFGEPLCDKGFLAIFWAVYRLMKPMVNIKVNIKIMSIYLFIKK